ncbi:MAG TPA: FHA domain-containing protein [Polyangiaceae bacterium]|nr:FHA domain-containing protein [Polyangiaceae bacterium]
MISPASGAKAPAFSIVIHEKGGAERREVFDSTEVSVGRVQGNHIVLPKGNVSKRHARLLYRDGRFIVTDLNSTNGTYVNRRRIAQATIVREGDRIYVGDFVLRIEPAAESADVPAGADESARSTSRTDSSPPSAPSQGAPPPQSSHGSFPDDAPGRPTALSFDPGTPRTSPRSVPDSGELGADTTDLSDSVATLVARVAERLGSHDFRRPADPTLEARVEPLLRELWKLQERELHGVEGERVIARARAELLDLGPLGPLLADASIAEIGVPRFDRVVVGRAGRPFAFEPGFSSELSMGWALHRLCEQSGIPLRPDEVSVERRLPSGATLEFSLGTGLPHGSVLVLRRPRRSTLTLDELVRRGTISRAIAVFLQHCVAARLNLLVVGARDGGPETLLGALSIVQAEGASVWIVEAASPPFSAMARIDPGLQPDRLHRAVQVAARVPSSRLVADITSPGLASSIVDAIGEGADGVIASRFGVGLGRALSRLVGDLCRNAPSTTPAAARELVASSFDVALEVAQLRDGRYRVVRVAEILGASPQGLELSDIFTFVADRTAAGGAIEGTFVPSGTVAHIAETLRARGIQLEAALFSRPLSR